MTVPAESQKSSADDLSIRQPDDPLRRLVLSQLATAGAGESFRPQDVRLPDDMLDRLRRHVASICEQLIRPTTAAFLGPMGSYSAAAAVAYFGPAVDLSPVLSIATVLQDVQRCAATRGIVPVENSTDGRVVDTLSSLIGSPSVQAVGEIRLAIHHALCSATPRRQIREIHSKAQALSQCRQFLDLHFPDARRVETHSTAAAAATASQTPGVAAVASPMAAELLGLPILHRGIEDQSGNATRFLVVAGPEAAPCEPTGHDKTTLLFEVAHRPGSLAAAITTFASHAINLTWIESFPRPQRAGEYLFIVEFDGHRDDAPTAAMLQDLHGVVDQLRVVGSYPRGRLLDE